MKSLKNQLRPFRLKSIAETNLEEATNNGRHSVAKAKKAVKKNSKKSK